MTESLFEDIAHAWELDKAQFEVVEDGDWIVEHKYEMKETVVKHLETGKFYSFNESRTGSYYSDYHWEEPDIYEVTPVTKMVEITTWSIVKKVD